MNVYDLTWVYDQHRGSSIDDIKEWKRIIGRDDMCPPSVDKQGNAVPFGTGPHGLKALRLFTVTHSPTSLFEIGFNYGDSTRAWLSLGVQNVVSCDIRKSSVVEEGAKSVSERFPGRFRLFNEASDKYVYEGEFFDAAFIDGDHSESGILTDIGVCRRLGIEKMLFDDFWPQHGETIPAIKKAGLTVDWISGNMIACTDFDRSGFVYT